MNSQASGILEGKRLLVVEDSFLVAAALERSLSEAGATVVGPAPTVSAAMAIVERGELDAGVLDVNLGAETSERVADRLQQLGIPVLFVTGFASIKMMAEHLRSVPRLMKPVEKTTLCRTLKDLMVRKL